MIPDNPLASNEPAFYSRAWIARADMKHPVLGHWWCSDGHNVWCANFTSEAQFNSAFRAYYLLPAMVPLAPNGLPPSGSGLGV